MDGTGQTAPYPDHAGKHAGGGAHRSAPERGQLLPTARTSQRRPLARHEAAAKILPHACLHPPRPAASRREHRRTHQGIEGMSDILIPVSPEWRAHAFIDQPKYEEMYARSVRDPDSFWREQAQRIDWIKPFTKVKDVSWDPDDLHVKWFEDGTVNVSANCVDRHLPKRAKQTAIIWEPDDPNEQPRHISYEELHREVCRFANVLKSHGVKKDDRVTIYLPMIPEAAYAMLACARIGAVHSVIFAGFSPDSIAGRIEDCQSTIVITADEGLRGGRKVPLKANVDAAIAKSGGVG